MSIDIVIARLGEAKDVRREPAERLGIVEVALDDLKSIEKDMRKVVRAALPGGSATGQSRMFRDDGEPDVPPVLAGQVLTADGDGVVRTPADGDEVSGDGSGETLPPATALGTAEQALLEALSDTPQNAVRLGAAAGVEAARARVLLQRLGDLGLAERHGRRWRLATASASNGQVEHVRYVPGISCESCLRPTTDDNRRVGDDGLAVHLDCSGTPAAVDDDDRIIGELSEDERRVLDVVRELHRLAQASLPTTAIAREVDGLDRARVREVLGSLAELGLVERAGGSWMPTTARVGR